MRYILILFLLALYVSCNKNEKVVDKRFVKTKIKLSEIDSLRTDADIEKYIGKKDTLYKIFKLKNIQSINSKHLKKYDSLNKILANKINVKYSYVKADFDNNGYTDLLAIGDNDTNDSNKPSNLDIPFTKDFNAIVLMNFSSKKTKLYDLDKDLFYPIVPKVEYINSQPFITVYKQKTGSFIGRLNKKILLKGKEETKSKLTFKYGGFIEYNPKENSYNIEKIEFYMSPCMGNCPLYNFEINNDRTAKFTEEFINFSISWEKVNFLSSTISENEFNELINILNYIDFVKLSDKYSVNWSDDQGAILKVTYNNGKIKTIEDYGLLGTYGLQRVYEMLIKLKSTQKWK